MGYVYSATATIILLFIVLIIQKKNKNRADYLLIIINMLIGLFLVADLLVANHFSSFAIILQNVLPLLLFPTFIYYVLQYIGTGSGLRKYAFLFFLPGLGLLLYSIFDHYLLNPYDAADLLEHYNRPDWVYQSFFKGSQILFIIVLLKLTRELGKFETSLKDGFSEIETISVSWLKNFTWIYLLSISLTFLLFLSQNIGLIPFEINQVFGVVYGMLVISVFYMNVNGIKHYTISQLYAEEKELQVTALHVGQKEEPSPSEADINLHQRMIQWIEGEKVYLQPKYGLADLAAELGESTHAVSFVINRLEKKSFYDLINGYRVEHLKMLLSDPNNRKYTVLALGLESGFNSKASINRIFKNHTGFTPREFLNNMAQSAG